MVNISAISLKLPVHLALDKCLWFELQLGVRILSIVEIIWDALLLLVDPVGMLTTIFGTEPSEFIKYVCHFWVTIQFTSCVSLSIAIFLKNLKSIFYAMLVHCGFTLVHIVLAGWLIIQLILNIKTAKPEIEMINSFYKSFYLLVVFSYYLQLRGIFPKKKMVYKKPQLAIATVSGRISEGASGRSFSK